MLSDNFVTMIDDSKTRITFREAHLLWMVAQRFDYCREIFLFGAKRSTNSSTRVIRKFPDS